MTTTVGTPPGVIASGYKAAGPVTPDKIPGLGAWFDAADEATISTSLRERAVGGVSIWADKSPNGNNLTMPTTTARPITGTRTLNGRNVLDFDGADDRLTATAITLPQPWTTIVVAQSDVTAGVRPLIASPGLIRLNATAWQMNAGTTLAGGASDLLAHVHVCTFNGATSTYHVDGTVRGSGNAGVNGYVAAVFGVGTNANSWDGIVAEVIVYNRVLTAPERTSLEASLKTKWATV